MASPILFCFTIFTGVTDSTSMLYPSWIQYYEDYLPLVRPGVQTQSGFQLSNSTRSKTAFCISKTLTFSTAPRCLISSPTCQSLTVPQTFGLVGLRKPEKSFQTGSRMIDSNRTALCTGHPDCEFICILYGWANKCCLSAESGGVLKFPSVNLNNLLLNLKNDDTWSGYTYRH